MDAVAEPEATEAEAVQTERSDTQKDAPAISQLEREWIDELQAAQRHADKLDFVRQNAESEAKRAKKNHEAAVDALQEIIRRGPSSQLPLDFKDGAQPDQTDEERYHAKLMAAPITEALKLTDKQIEKLEAAGVETVGDFENLRAGKHPDYPGGLMDLPRVGQTTVDNWEDEILEWFDQKQMERDGEQELAEHDAAEPLVHQIGEAFEKAGIMDKVHRNVKV